MTNRGFGGNAPHFKQSRCGLRGGKEGQAIGWSLQNAVDWPDPPQKDATTPRAQLVVPPLGAEGDLI
ncbi:hypothetical protein TBH_C0965 [Thiolapillus brandeum]|uniref:Uncharacterized protein n=1 Tax=Thiolapillus brandeum TaxID=1076588 RepID=A0A7U6GHU5_9GAMM|nr:hypothetical protein TBH_C0965 [Thiolapillus brandeum]